MPLGEMISIIIPVYNSVSSIEECVNSVVAQEGVEKEIILVDDGSTDGSGKLCDLLADKFSEVIALHKSNGGVSSARNAGIEAAKGKYVYFVDSDDKVPIGGIKALIDAAESTGADLVIANFVEHNIAQNKFNKISANLPVGAVLDRKYIREELLKRFYLGNCSGLSNIWNKLFRADGVKPHGVTFDPLRTHGEDWKFVIEYLICSKTVVAISDVVYVYEIDGSQTLDKYDHGMVNSLLQYYPMRKKIFSSGNFSITPEERMAVHLNGVSAICRFLSNNPSRKDIRRLNRNLVLRKNMFCALSFPQKSLESIGYSRRICLKAFLLGLGLYGVVKKLV